MSAENKISQTKEKTVGTGKIYSYPNKTGDFKTLLQFKQYQYASTGDLVTKIDGTAIELPLPEAIVDSMGVNINAEEVGVLGSLAASAGSTISNANPNDIKSAINDIDNVLSGTAKDIGESTRKILGGNASAALNALGKSSNVALYAVRSGLAGIAPSVTNAFGAGVKTAVNPFSTLIFSGVNLKNFNLSWTLSPESPDDSEYIRKIINAIRANMLPEYDSPLGAEEGNQFGISAIDRGLLTYPMMVDILFTGIDPNYYFKFKTCMISDFQTNFTPNGLSITRGGKPAVVNLSMSLKEAYIHTRKDYDDVSGTDTGSVGGFGEITTQQDVENAFRDSVALNDTFGQFSGTQFSDEDIYGYREFGIQESTA